MSVTYGFYNSKDGDRRYDAIQMSSIFDGIIEDGILQHVGTAMMVKESEAMIVNVGIGRAWFNHTWTLNDALLPLEVPQSEVLLNRCDAVVLEVDFRESVRANSIKIVKGTPATNPTKPAMVKTNDRWQYPLAYIYVGVGVTSIRQSDITNCVGTSECPFVTAPLEKMSIDDLIAKWEAQWTGWMEKNDAAWSAWSKKNDTYWNNWTETHESDFNTWFSEIKGILGEDAATSLATQILELKKAMGEPALVTLTADGWTGTEAPYEQTVTVSGATADMEPILVSALTDGAVVDVQKAYMKAYGIISSGTATLGDGSATFKVYKKPETDCMVGLKGVY